MIFLSPLKTLLILAGLFVFVFAAAFYVHAAEALRTRKKASFYGEGYRGKLMANGQPYDPRARTCACWGYPLGTQLLVEHGERFVIVTVTDRGPAKQLGRAIDLSEAAFEVLADRKLGVIDVEISTWAEAKP